MLTSRRHFLFTDSREDYIFSQVSVCPQGEGVSVGGLCPRGSLSTGVSVQGVSVWGVPGMEAPLPGGHCSGR